MLESTNMANVKGGVKVNKTTLRQQGKFAEIEVLKKADNAHHAFKQDLKKVFENNSKFAAEFTYEAMTGLGKFGGNDGTAEHFLVCDYDGNANMHPAKSSSDSYVKKIAGQVKPDVKFKTTSVKRAELKSPKNPEGKSGYYTFWSTIGLGVKMIIDEEVKSSNLLTEEGNIDEGKWWDMLKRGFKKVTTWFGKVWKKIKNVIGQSWDALIGFMGWEPIVKHNNEPTW
jgi:hypothetical protein